MIERLSTSQISSFCGRLFKSGMMFSMWIDTHAHLDAQEFEPDRPAVISRARSAGVQHIVLPAVEVGNFEVVRELAHAHGLSYALGIHPLFVQHASDEDLALLQAALQKHREDPRLVAVG